MTDESLITADDIPVAHTPVGGWTTMPPPVLTGCTEPLAPGVADLRGTWNAFAVEIDGIAPPPDHNLWSHVERIEQCGDRVVITAGGLVHDMRADGDPEHGVNDVAAATGQPIQVAATFEAGVLVLRPVGLPGIEVTRRLDGDDLVWHYLGNIVVHLRREATSGANR